MAKGIMLHADGCYFDTQRAVFPIAQINFRNGITL